MTTRLTSLLVVLALGWFVSPAHAQELTTSSKIRTISVSGEGVVRVQPDQATVRFGIVTRAPDPEEARRLNAEAASNAMNAVRDLGIPEGKLRLETLQLQPAREFDPDTRRYEENGFEATRTVVAEVDDLDVLPTLVANVVARGANRLEGIGYDLKDRDAARNEALREALLNARDKARMMVQTLDVELGPVMTINEQSFDFPRPFIRMEQASLAMAKDESAPEPEAYAAGEIEVRAVVQVVFVMQ